MHRFSFYVKTTVTVGFCCFSLSLIVLLVSKVRKLPMFLFFSSCLDTLNPLATAWNIVKADSFTTGFYHAGYQAVMQRHLVLTKLKAFSSSFVATTLGTLRLSWIPCSTTLLLFQEKEGWNLNVSVLKYASHMYKGPVVCAENLCPSFGDYEMLAQLCRYRKGSSAAGVKSKNHWGSPHENSRCACTQKVAIPYFALNGLKHHQLACTSVVCAWNQTR